MTDPLSEFCSTAAAGVALRWYYCSAAGELGLRSCQGAFEDTMHRKALAEHKDGCVRVHESESSSPRESVTERMFYAAHRANTIGQRLRRLTTAQRQVAEAQYGGDIVLGDSGISIGVALLTTTAQSEHANSSGATPVVTLARLHTLRGKDSHADAVLARVIAEARARLDEVNARIVD